MNYITRQPMIIKNMMKLNEDYALLKKRRSTLLDELYSDTKKSQALKSLRQTELHVLNTNLRKIDRFLMRYGFISRSRNTNKT